MTVHSRYRKVAHQQEVKADAHRGPELRHGVPPPPLNRHQRRAQESAKKSAKKLLITRRGK